VIGVDTNILLRMYDRSDAAQAEAADRLVADKAGGCLVNPIVLAEFAWTLDRTYKLDRESIAERVDRIVKSSEYVVAFPEAAMAALANFRNGSAGFADYLSAELNHSLGCETTYTFDRAAARADGFTLLNA
jgi:predicted nucleic-acid-binding protein